MSENTNTEFSNADEDALTEALNIGVGRAAGSLSNLIGRNLLLTFPLVQLLHDFTLGSESDGADGVESCVSVSQNFRGPANGRATLLFSLESGTNLATLMGSEEDPDDEMGPDSQGIITEVGNIILNGALGSIGNLLDGKFDFTVPRFESGHSRQELLNSTVEALDGDAATPILTRAQFKVEGETIEGFLLLIFEIGAGKALADALNVANT